eukprot:752357-Hanusia_phi.AAC.1
MSGCTVVGVISSEFSCLAGHAIFSISREDLNFALLQEIEKMSNVTIEFEKKFESFDAAANVVHLTGKEGEKSSITARNVIGADGAFSK